MIVQRIRGVYHLLVLLQAIVLTVVYWLTFAGFVVIVSPGTGAFTARYTVYWLALLVGLFAEILVRDRNKLGTPLYDRSLLKQFPIAARQEVYSLGALLVFLVLNQDHIVSRAFLFVLTPALYAGLLFSNAALPPYLVRRLFRGARENRTLLVGPAGKLSRLFGWIQRKSQLGVRVVGLISPEAPEGTPTSVPWLGGADRLPAILGSGEITQVILLELGDLEIAHRLIELCQEHGLRLLIVNDLADQLHHPTISFEDDGLHVITLHEEPLENPLNRMLKRTIDIVFAVLVVLFILPPLAVFFWLIHRLQSRGPLLHRQQRAGMQNRAFEIIKFRTMHSSGDLNQPAFSGDERVFPAGRWLRKFGLDEMPQFLNVLRGEMSVVGPRPHLLEHNREMAELLAKYHLRTFIKPGITGLAQVRGFRGDARTPEELAARLQSDLIYLENWSLPLEMGIILRTCWQMISPPRSAV